MHLIQSKKKLPLIEIKNNILYEEQTITLPKDYWTTVYTIKQNHEDDQPLKIIKLPTQPKKSKPPKISYWEITQGDYRVRERYREMNYYRELKKKLLKVMLLLAIGISGYVTYLISYLLSGI